MEKIRGPNLRITWLCLCITFYIDVQLIHVKITNRSECHDATTYNLFFEQGSDCNKMQYVINILSPYLFILLRVACSSMIGDQFWGQMKQHTGATLIAIWLSQGGK